MTRIVHLNGAFVPEEAAQVSVFDRGYLFADGVYEVTAVVERRLVDLEPHLVRLRRSLDALGMACPVPMEALAGLHRELIVRNDLREGVVYLQVTRGVAERDFAYPADAAPSLLMFTQVKPLVRHPMAERGVAVVTTPDLRWKRRDIKSIALLPQAMGKQVAAEAGAFEAWMVEDGCVTEGTSSSAFVVTPDGAILARPNGHDILPGVTRAAILDLARETGLRVEERRFTVEEAKAGAEAFLTSASTFVLPVVAIDGAPVGDGTPGPWVRRLRELYLRRAEGKQAASV